MTHTLTLHISSEMAEVISLVAQSEDATLGEVIRDAIRKDVKSRLLAKADPPVQWHSHRPVANLLMQDIEAAESWRDLHARLFGKGYHLRHAQGALTLYRTTGERMCSLSDIGQSEAALVKRFATPFDVEREPKAMAG